MGISVVVLSGAPVVVGSTGLVSMHPVEVLAIASTVVLNYNFKRRPTLVTITINIIREFLQLVMAIVLINAHCII